MTNGTVVEHVYDADGNRVRTTVDGVPTNYLVDTCGGGSCNGSLSHVVAETNGVDGLTALYVRIGDELLAVMRPDGHGGWISRFVHHDGIGSVRALTDEGGVVSDTRGYEAFGNENTRAGTDSLAYGFAGEAFQAESKLAYHRARWMDSRVGRFAGVDPAEGEDENPITRNPYIYAGDNPPVMIDATGRDYSLSEVVAVSIGIGILAGLSMPTSPQGRGTFARTANNGQIWANIRAREAGGVIFSHLYIEYVDKSKNLRVIFEGLHDNTPHLPRPDGYLHGMAPRQWGKPYNKGDDSGAPYVGNREAFEQESDEYSGLLGVGTDTYACLERARETYNGHPVYYDAQNRGGDYGHNSNWWAVNVCKACDLWYGGLPGLILVGDHEDPAFGQ